jgi:hypothetical protein
MLKNFAFGILAAALAVAPGAAFAGQAQSNVQSTTQNGAAINGSTNAQSSTSTNRQQQIQNAQKKRGSYYKPGYRNGNQTPQSQGSAQRTNQSGAAIDGSVNAQDSTTRNNQTQNARRSR